jgi:hypothetical protein
MFCHGIHQPYVFTLKVDHCIEMIYCTQATQVVKSIIFAYKDAMKKCLVYVFLFDLSVYFNI